MQLHAREQIPEPALCSQAALELRPGTRFLSENGALAVDALFDRSFR